jgi:hypothetical protein
MIPIRAAISNVMPYADENKQAEAVRRNMRAYRKRLADNDEYKAAEKVRKAAWYAANKEKKAEAQRRYRAAKRGKS